MVEDGSKISKSDLKFLIDFLRVYLQNVIEFYDSGFCICSKTYLLSHYNYLRNLLFKLERLVNL